MKNLSKDEILSLYVNKVQVLKEIISSKSDKHCNECYENSEDENTSILLEIKEIDVLEKVMGYNNELKEEEINET
jgi:hypothetical protein